LGRRIALRDSNALKRPYFRLDRRDLDYPPAFAPHVAHAR
jgi:hypothetical protein